MQSCDASAPPDDVRHALPIQKMVLALLLLFNLPTLVIAQDDGRADKVLEGLKQRGYLELADHYLDRLNNSNLVSDEWKRKIPFERAALIVEFAATSSSDDIDARLKEATDLLKRFVEENPGEAAAEDASMELAKLKMAQGHRAVAQAARQEDEAARQKLLDQAGTAFRSAETKFRQRKNVLGEQLKGVQQAPEAQQDQAALDKMRSDFLFARMTVAMLEYEQAKLARDDQKKYNKQMQDALKEFGKISKEFRERLIGLEAVHYQGRCYQDLGDLETALDYYEQLLQLTQLPDLLLNRTLARVIECYLQLEQPARAITMGEKWLGRGGDRQQTGEAAEVRVSLAAAYIAAAELESGRKQQRNLDQARTQLMRAARIPGQQQARLERCWPPCRPRRSSSSTPSEINDFAAAKLAAEAGAGSNAIHASAGRSAAPQSRNDGKH